MRSSINKILLASILSISFAIADDGSFDSLLKDIKQKTDKYSQNQYGSYFAIAS